jgi:hypothetical protein
VACFEEEIDRAATRMSPETTNTLCMSFKKSKTYGLKQSDVPRTPSQASKLGRIFLFRLAFSFHFLILACKIHFIFISCPKNLCNPNFLSNFAAQNCFGYDKRIPFMAFSI